MRSVGLQTVNGRILEELQTKSCIGHILKTWSNTVNPNTNHSKIWLLLNYLMNTLGRGCCFAWQDTLPLWHCHTLLIIFGSMVRWQYGSGFSQNSIFDSMVRW